MDSSSTDFTQAEFQRTPGRRGGCGCCAFTLVGLAALPTLLIASLVLLIWP